MNHRPADTPAPASPEEHPDAEPRDVRRSEFSEASLEVGRRAYGFRRSFPAAPRSVGKARHFVRESLSGVGIDPADATLAVSEMVTVALSAATGGDHIEVSLRLRGREIDIEVCSPQGRAELSDVQAAVMGAVADFYDRREVGDVDVQSFGCLVKTQPLRRSEDPPV
jgi:hypothetical protein